MSYEHGTVSRYIHRGCRCDECRRAKAAYRRDHEIGPPRIVDVSGFCRALREMYGTGLTLGQIARRGGVRPQLVSAIILGRKRTARVDTAAKLAMLVRGQAL